eukprot:GHVP01000737.1.p1 GENE.GHVP01000737.1~~GHVP01000737.1.p1  ORF type:complete len:372 (+),score=62.87 GHVP01000737.1:1541-2656(+)
MAKIQKKMTKKIHNFYFSFYTLKIYLENIIHRPKTFDQPHFRIPLKWKRINIATLFENLVNCSREIIASTDLKLDSSNLTLHHFLCWKRDDISIPQYSLTQSQSSYLAKLVKKLLKFNHPKSKTFKSKKKFLIKFKEILSPLGVDVQTFGSFRTGLCLQDGDIDVVLKSNNADFCLSDIREIIDTEDRFIVKQFSSKARVPFLKLESQKEYTKVEPHLMDVVVKNDTSIAKAELIIEYKLCDHRFRKLALLVKLWTSERKIAGGSSGHLPSFAWTIMVIYFLQNRSNAVLPNLQDERLLEGEPRTFVCQPSRITKETKEFETTFSKALKFMAIDKRCLYDNNTSVPALFFEFLVFYAMQFDLRHGVVSLKG